MARPTLTRLAARERATTELNRMRRRRGSARLAPPPGCDVVDHYLIVTHGDLRAAAQAAALGVRPALVSEWRASLARRGLLQLRARGAYDRITPDEIAAIVRLYRDDRLSKPRIAALREIPLGRVARCLDMAGVTGAPRAARFTATDLGVIFGHTSSKVTRAWVARGWLPAARVYHTERRGDGTHYGFTRADVFALLANRESWVAWEPGQITDPEFTAYARMQRAAAGGAWRSRSEIAAALGVRPYTLTTWIDAGLFATYPQAAYGSEDFIWLRTAEYTQVAALASPIAAAARQGPRLAQTASRRVRATLFAHFGPRQVSAAD